MRAEQSPDQLIDQLERRFNRMKRFKSIWADIVLSSILMSSAEGYIIAREAMYPDDTLPHD